MRKKLKRIAIGTLAVICLMAAWVYCVPFPAELLSRDRITPPRVFDRYGRLLREGLSPDATHGRWVALSEISPWLIEATLVAEDRRFRTHWGVDGWAVLRAAWDDLRARRRVSGASTITMQLVRLLRPRERTWAAKLDEAILAIRLERLLTKDQILEEYLNRAPYGGNCIGAEAAALRTFGKPAHDLSPAEAALLAGLPQGPARLDPLRFGGRALRRQRWILDEMLRTGKIDGAAHRSATEEALSVEPRAIPFEAPEFVEWLGPEGRTTLDLDLQHEVEGIVRAGRSHLAAAGAGEAAVVVLDNATGDVLAFVGPAAARRSPGSALKPLVYALAIESGRTPATIYEDAPAHFDTPVGEYSPRNYDGVFHGPVTMRQALANSLNVPAVLALQQVGVGRFVRLLREIGLEGAEAHGLGLILGDCRVSPVELAGAYSMLAREGEFIRPHGRPERQPSLRVLPAPVCWLIADILSDDNARALSFGTNTELAFDFRVAAKTGTSVDHRDNWVAGFTARRTVVVWVGNADGRPLRGTSGLEGAGPLFHAVMQHVEGPWLTRPEGIEQAEVCSESGLHPTTGCDRTIREWFLAGQSPKEACAPRERSFRVDSPRPSDLFAIDPESPGSTRFIAFSATAPEGASVEWFLDGAPLVVTRGEHSVRWPARAGSFELRARCDGKEVRRRFKVGGG